MRLILFGMVGSALALSLLSSCDDEVNDPLVEAGVGDDDLGDDDVPADDDLGDDDLGDDDLGDDDLADDDGAATPDGGLPDPHAVPDASAQDYQCALLGTTCHPFDRGTGDLGDECHDIGHEGDPEACADVFDACMAFCSADAGPAHPQADGGPAHPEADGGPAHPQADGGRSLCQELGERCHAHDTGDGGLASECHEVGHAGDESACATIYDECIALCTHATDAG